MWNRVSFSKILVCILPLVCIQFAFRIIILISLEIFSNHCIEMVIGFYCMNTYVYICNGVHMKKYWKVLSINVLRNCVLRIVNLFILLLWVLFSAGLIYIFRKTIWNYKEFTKHMYIMVFIKELHKNSIW